MRQFLLNEAEMIDYAQQNTGVLIAECVIGVVLIIAMWRLFERSGEPGWNAIVPFYDLYKLFKIAVGNGWLFIMLFIPILRAIAIVVLGLNLARAFGKSNGFALGLVFLPVIFIPMLAFSDGKYIGPRGMPSYSGFNTNKTNTYSNPPRQTQPDDLEDFNESEAKTVEFEVEKSDE